MDLKTISELQFLTYKWGMIASSIVVYFGSIYRLVTGKFDGFLAGQVVSVIAISLLPLTIYKIITHKHK